jgi:hypothetical protein
MSNYEGFPVMYETTAGVPTSIGAGVDVLVRAQGEVSDAAESPLTTDANGEIAAGSLAAVDPGTVVYFRIELFEGMAGSVAQITT